MSRLTDHIEHELAREAGLAIAVEEDGARLVLTGLVSTNAEHETALEIARDLAQGRDVDDDIAVEGAVPEDLGRGRLSDEDVGIFVGATPGLESHDALSPADFEDQGTLVDPRSAAGPTDTLEDAVSEGDAVYIPPTDPVGTNREVIGGFQADSMEDLSVERSALDGQYGDEALADAVRRELREDAATTDLEVYVEVQQRVALLRGRVPLLSDAENAEAVASRIPGLVEVREEIEVEGM